MRTLLSLLSFIAAMSAAVPAFADGPDVAAREYFTSEDEAARVLARAGGRFDGLVGLERVPGGDYVVEAAIALDEVTLRYPLKLRRTGGAFRVTWQPVPEFAEALAGLARSGELPRARSDVSYADLPRIPSLVIVATRSRFVTPFGVVPVDDQASEDAPGDLEWSPMLIEHTRRWIADVLQDDPAPAELDLLLDRNLSWKLVSKVIFNLSSAGLYRIHFVVDTERGLHVVTATAPVHAAAASAPAVALYPRERGWGVRISSEEEGERCDDQFELCIGSDEELAASLERWLQPGGESVMFAAVEAVPAGIAVAMLAAIADFSGVQPHRLFVGYVQR